MENTQHEVNMAGEIIEKIIKEITSDTETTGIPPKKVIDENGQSRDSDYKLDFLLFPRIVTIAWKVDNQETKEFIINQEGFVIPEESIAIHGITNEMCNESPFLLATVMELFIKDCAENTALIGHNIYFDTSIMKANFLRLIVDGKLTQKQYLNFEDILHKDKRIDTMRKSIKFCDLKGKWPKLIDLYSKLFNEEFNAHSAKDDVDATRRCYLELKVRGII